jgi:hypothetical protein
VYFATPLTHLVIRFLKIEVRLLQIDTVIKAKLSLDKADTKPVLQVLEELKNLKLSPIMLKKHPDIVFTIKKVIDALLLKYRLF